MNDVNGQHEAFDVIVLGGGPGGSSAASFVAMQGHSVLLLEKERFPRHQIGESLLPATTYGICSLLGIRDRIERAGFPRKNGGTFRWGKNPEPWTFRFAANPRVPGGYAYQVERSVFDKMLLDAAREKGVDVREQHTVLGVDEHDGRLSRVRFRDDRGVERVADAKYVVDSEGNRGQHYQLVGERVFSQFFQNVALFGYFHHGKRLPAPNEGNILCAAFRDGWFWYIPLSDTLTSVGAVVSREAAQRIQDGPEQALRGYIEACPVIAEYLAPATRVTEGMYGELRVRKDYSYCNTRFWKPGLVLIGDAACFIDPVFSSGVHLATYSALLAARSINSYLGGGLDEHEVFEEFEFRYRREFGNFYQFLLAFYDMHQDEESYFWNARKVINTEEKANDAFIRLVAGASCADEPIFDAAAEFFRSRQGMGPWFEGMLGHELAMQVDGLPEVKPPPVALDGGPSPEQFMEGFTAEVRQIQMQAMYGGRRARESSIRARGLIPSQDGFAWRADQR
ncbi:MAG TPA: tryptophan 7-halogenase [Kofleriaceae bacterium]|nr:tryptophan 7-halogenase [Kofleriaceae bacterium]